MYTQHLAPRFGVLFRGSYLPICGMSTGILLNSRPFVCRATGGRPLTILPSTWHPWKVRLGFTPAAVHMELEPLHDGGGGCIAWKICGTHTHTLAPEGNTACAEETAKNVRLATVHRGHQEFSHCFTLGGGASSLLLSTCRLNILFCSIVSGFPLLFWLASKGKGRQVTNVMWREWDTLQLLINRFVKQQENCS